MKFSIIIPTYNRKQQLINCINSIINTTYPKNNFEVIIVNDNSTDDTEEYLKKITQRNISYYNNIGKGPALARNLGAKMAKGMYLIFIDDDCTIDDNYLWLIDRKTNDFFFSLAGGIIKNLSITKYSQVLEYMTLFYQKEQNFSNDTPKFLTSNNMICLKTDFIEIGGFDETFFIAGGEDRDLSNRFFAANKNVLFFQDLIVFHHHNLNFKRFFKQQYNYGLGAFLLRAKHDKIKIKRNRILKTHLDMIFSIFKNKNLFDSISYTLIIILSQLFVTTGFISASLFKKQKEKN